MSDNDKFAIAAHLSVLLRRKIGRAIDTLWMLQNAEYAQEIVRVARAHADADISRLVDRFEELMAGLINAPAATTQSVTPTATQPTTTSEAAVTGKYVGRLR